LIYLKKANINIVIDNSGLIATALLIAESDPKQKEVIINLIVGIFGDG
jgi:hypothetical protein